MNKNIYIAEKTYRMRRLNGVQLASFRQRAFAIIIDSFIVFVLFIIAIGLISFVIWSIKTTGSFTSYSFKISFETWYGKLLSEVLVPVLYFGLTTYFTDGFTIGKKIMHIRVVSVLHKHLSLWHSLERALGYGAASLEFGFGFFQYFIYPNRRTVQDRIAETIVISLREKKNKD